MGWVFVGCFLMTTYTPAYTQLPRNKQAAIGKKEAFFAIKYIPSNNSTPDMS